MPDLEINAKSWLKGEESLKYGYVYKKSPAMYDIFGFMLKKAGYLNKDLIGIRVPSQLAQIKLSSGHPLPGLAYMLTTPGHADTEDCIALGKINDDPNIDDDKRFLKIKNILAKYGTYVYKTEQSVTLSDEALTALIKNWMDSIRNISDPYDYSFFRTLLSNEIVIYYTKYKATNLVFAYNPNSGIVLWSAVLGASSQEYAYLNHYHWRIEGVMIANKVMFYIPSINAQLGPEIKTALERLRAEEENF